MLILQGDLILPDLLLGRLHFFLTLQNRLLMVLLFLQVFLNHLVGLGSDRSFLKFLHIFT